MTFPCSPEAESGLLQPIALHVLQSESCALGINKIDHSCFRLLHLPAFIPIIRWHCIPKCGCIRNFPWEEITPLQAQLQTTLHFLLSAVLSSSTLAKRDWSLVQFSFAVFKSLFLLYVSWALWRLRKRSLCRCHGQQNSFLSRNFNQFNLSPINTNF